MANNWLVNPESGEPFRLPPQNDCFHIENLRKSREEGLKSLAAALQENVLADVAKYETLMRIADEAKSREPRPKATPYLSDEDREKFEVVQGQITAEELISRLSKLPPDTLLETQQYDYYVDLICISETNEVIWKP